MFENLLYQNVSESLSRDIREDRLPGALLLSGSGSSGKLTCALETARILSCTGPDKGSWMCTCPSCMQHKVMADQNLVLTGPRDCSLEIAAAKGTFLRELESDSSHLNAARYLFIRSVRKLTLRFREILWENDDRIAKIAAVMEPINDDLEILDPVHTLPAYSQVQKICTRIEKNCRILEDSFLYDSIPIQQIRNVSMWARMKTQNGKKVVIIENADRMLESVRNALLKILEEPPADTIFILTTRRRGAVMPTILSRVRTYTFQERTTVQQREVIRRIFHEHTETPTIDSYLKTFLTVPPSVIAETASYFYRQVISGSLPDVQKILKECSSFSPRILFKIFLQELIKQQSHLVMSQRGSEASARIVQEIHTCWNNVTTFNQSPVSALESFVRSLALISKQYGGLK